MEIPNSIIIGGFAVPLGLVGVVWGLLNGKIEAGDKALIEKIEAGDNALIEKIDTGHDILLEKMAELFNETSKCERTLNKKVDTLAANTVDPDHCALKERLAVLRFDAIEKENERKFKVLDSKVCAMQKENVTAHGKLEDNDEKNHECLIRIDKTLAVMNENQKKRKEDIQEES